MDTAAKRAYVDARLAKARDDLSTARDDLTHGHLRGATNRAYYAIFHVASAALLWHDVERAKHSGIQSAFNEFFVKPGVLEPEYGRIYSRARKAREEQDYDLEAAPLTAEDAKQIVAGAERFLVRLERYLREVGAIA
jgi:uncharacterized protein (UPF0332 family)